MSRLNHIELGHGSHATRLPVLYEDRVVLAIDKPAGWLLVPFSWQRTQRNLQAALTSSIAAGDYWARSRNIKFLRAVHRLDGDTSGVLLLARSLGAVNTLGDLFEGRRMSKLYLAVVSPPPRQASWNCTTPIGPEPGEPGRMRLDPTAGKPAETAFAVLQSTPDRALVAARPTTGRTHQIRLHLLEAGCPILGDALYTPGTPNASPRSRTASTPFPMGLRAVGLAYQDPFRRQPIRIVAPIHTFTRHFGFDPSSVDATLAGFAAISC